MRLVCPNCDAEYEVDDAAIPRTGRDVQCSNCGHAWFQLNPDVIAEEQEEEALFGAPAHVATDAAPADPFAADADHFADDYAEDHSGGPSGGEPEDVAAAEAEAWSEPDPDDVLPETDADLPDTTPGELTAAAADAPVVDLARMAPPPAPPPPAAPPPAAPPSSASQPLAPRSVDASVLAVLREEAEREAAARKAEMPALETQTEMPLDQAASARKAVPPTRPLVEPAKPEASGRSKLLPAIEEINSSLRASSDRGEEEDGAMHADATEEAKAAGGFRRGFLTLVLLGVVVLVLYILAPMIGSKVPALAGVAQSYVAAVDAGRLWLDTEIRTLIGWLRGLAGSKG